MAMRSRKTNSYAIIFFVAGVAFTLWSINTFVNGNVTCGGVQMSPGEECDVSSSSASSVTRTYGEQRRAQDIEAIAGMVGCPIVAIASAAAFVVNLRPRKPTPAPAARAVPTGGAAPTGTSTASTDLDLRQQVRAKFQAQVAASNGWTYDASAPNPVARLSTLFEWPDDNRATDVMSGTYKGASFIACTVDTVDRRSAIRTPNHLYIVPVTAVDSDIVVMPGRRADSPTTSAQHPPLDNGDPAFDRSFFVRTTALPDARARLRPDVTRFILKHPNVWRCVLSGRDLIVVRSSADKFLPTLDDAIKLAAIMEAAMIN